MADRTRNREGEQIGKYLLDKRLDRGSFCDVYRGIHVETGDKVVFRFSKHQEDDWVIRREVELLRQLDHPNVLKIQDCSLDVDVWSQLDYVEHSDGISNVGHYVRKIGPFKASDAIHITKQILEALLYVHKNGKLHRDIKPNNILIDSDLHAYLSDFNLGKDLEMQVSGDSRILSMQSKSMTGQSQFAPRDLKYDEQSDLYSLAATFSFIVLGKNWNPAQSNPAKFDAVPKELGDLVEEAHAPQDSRMSVQEFYDRFCKFADAKGLSVKTVSMERLIKTYVRKMNALRNGNLPLKRQQIQELGLFRQSLYQQLQQAGGAIPVPEIEELLKRKYLVQVKIVTDICDDIDGLKRDGRDLDNVDRDVYMDSFNIYEESKSAWKELLGA